jgi:hypothetical protein
MKNIKKKAAMELSISTIVVIVIAVTMLIFGIIFVRSIMCSALEIGDQASDAVKNELTSLFGADQEGVNCMGGRGHEITLGDGGRRQIICMSNTKEPTEYSFEIQKIESLRGTPEDIVKKDWLLDSDWSGIVRTGTETVVIAVLDIPERVTDTALKFTVLETNENTGTERTHILYIDVAHVGTFTRAIC